jgi:hypothetical protein
MAYQIDKFNKQLLTTVEDGTIDQTTDITFIGKNYAGYGEFHNENFLFLLESFASADGPAKPLAGQNWFDTANSKMKFYDGNKWRTTGGAEVSGSQPAGLSTGDFWWDNANEQLYVFNGSNFVLIGPQDAGSGITQMVSNTVIDSNDNTRSIIVSYINDLPIFVISQNQFTIKNVQGNTLDGFSQIKQGITLRDTDGVTGVTSSLYRFWGTAANASRLDGLSANDFIKSSDPAFTQLIETGTDGLRAGDVFSFGVDDSGLTPARGIIKNTSGLENEIHFRTINNLGNETHSLSINAQGLIPSQNETFDLGSPTAKFKNIYVDSVVSGASENANKVFVSSFNEYKSANVSAVAGTLPVRSADNKIFAEIFDGTATSARYADLAEKYTTDTDNEAGTVMTVCDHVDHETCACGIDDVAIGVISEKPAFLMNKDSNGQAIALKGRVPVRIKGAVKKGQRIYTWENGVASTTKTDSLIGIALESNNNSKEKLVECVLKV